MKLNTNLSHISSLERLPVALSVSDVAEVLGIGRSSAYGLVRCGRLRSIRIGRKIRIPKDALAEFLCRAN